MELGIATVTSGTALRSLGAAAFAVCAAIILTHELRRTSDAGRRWLWALLIAVIVAPDLIAGYAYSNFSLSLIRNPVWNELFLTLLIGLKAAAIAAAMLAFTPPALLSPSGRHLLRLSSGRIGWWRRLRILGRGSAMRVLPAAAVAFLFAFQQFELPSLTAATAWTVSLFDRQALVPDAGESARALLWPLLVEAIVVLPVLLLLRGASASKSGIEGSRHIQPLVRFAAWSVALLAAGLTFVYPLGLLAWEGGAGLGYVAAATPAAVSYWREVAVALASGVAAAAIGMLAAGVLLRLAAATGWRRRLGMILLVAACVPGLCGPLVPSLFAVAWLQTPLLLPLRDTLIPLVVVLSLTLLPRAVLMEALVGFARPGAALHLVRGLRSSPFIHQRRSARQLQWDLEGYGRYCRFALLAYWGYLDLTAATILAPPSVVPVTARLYNLMHYGHNASLSAMALVAVCVPLATFAVVLVLRRLVLRCSLLAPHPAKIGDFAVNSE